LRELQTPAESDGDGVDPDEIPSDVRKSGPNRTIPAMKILVMGSTGYIGGRLVPSLIEAGHDVRCLTRDPSRLQDVVWASRAEIVTGDALDQSSLEAAMEGVESVYYLVHSIGSGADFAESDRLAAENTGRAAFTAGVGRIVYLGGLVPQGEMLSPHLASRAEVGQVLLDSGVPTVVLQAGVILGSGSASFEMLRYLTERLPVMVTPKWVHSLVQPIAVRDVLTYLVRSLDLPSDTNRRFDIGGPDVLSYRDMMQRYAAVAGIRRRVIIPVPVLSPWLSSQWVNVVTPVPKAIAQPLIESLRNNVLVTEQDIARHIDLDLCPFDEAVRLSLQQIRDADVATRWSGATWPGAPSDPLPTDPEWSGGTVYQDERSVVVEGSAAAVWSAVEGIGGERGWYSFGFAWTLRGFLDRLIGGVGLRRGRRHPDLLAVGDAVDFWRVEALERGRLLRLRAEMRLPGEAWLEFRLAGEDHHTLLHQRAVFIPRGLAGHAYWWAISPLHNIVFGSMIRNLARAARPPAPPR
jgi:uncharacterized protein YbjT (DUF2867 family)